MSDTKAKYEAAVKERDRQASRVKMGMTESVQAAIDAAQDEVIKYRNKLIENGEWEGPIPIPVKAKYRNR